MQNTSNISRRKFLLAATLGLSAALLGPASLKRGGQARASQVANNGNNAPETESGREAEARVLLQPLAYKQVEVADAAAKTQLEATMAVLLALSTESLVKPFLTKAGKVSNAADLGGWYDYSPDYDWHKGTRAAERGFAPGHAFGQWMSGLARAYATTGDEAYKNKVSQMLVAYENAVSPEFYRDLRFPAYTYDKLVLGLVDAKNLAGLDSSSALEKTTRAALPFLPAQATEREAPVAGRDASYTWDESYTLPENLYLAYESTREEKYRAMARRYLLDRTLFDTLAAGLDRDVMAGKHAYSYVNALCSAARAFISDGSEKHLKAAKNGYDIVLAQSYATGGWGPDEQLRALSGDDLFKSLDKSHNNFETPCGAYAHLKLTRYLCLITGDSKYADSAERIIHNTILGIKPLVKDGSAFYYSDYNSSGKKVFSSHIWPCCAGSLAQVAADYGINTYLQGPAVLNSRQLYVLQYLDSSVKLDTEGQGPVFTQSREEDWQSGLEKITFKISGDKDNAPFSLQLRIPSYPADFELALSDDFHGDTSKLEPGKFFSVSATGRPDASFSLTIKHKLRLEKLNDKHPEMVALMYGPKVLFAVNAKDVATAGDITYGELMATKRVAQVSWQCSLKNGQVISFKPFTAIKDEPYTTYLKLS